MVITRTPFRISFFGGGTDYPAWYSRCGGATLATSINKYCYLTCRYLPPFFEHRIRVVYSKIENCQSVDEVLHPAVRETLRFLSFDRGVEIHHDGDLPARSGMGSSSSFTVGLLLALHAIRGHMPTRQQLASESIHVEQDLIKETVGSQDQVLASYGGFNHTTFHENGAFTVRPITIAPERMADLNSNLMLFFTGIARTASTVAVSYINRIEERAKEMRAIQGMVDEGISILKNGSDLRDFGRLLHEAWQAKRSLSEIVTNDEIEQIYRAARDAGAVGGKLTGAGGGGFLLLFVPPDRQDAVRNVLDKLICVPFAFEYSGSQVIFFEQEEDFRTQERLRAAQRIRAFREFKGNGQT